MAKCASSETSEVPDRAMQALRHLVESQWTNGLLPQIVFNPKFDKYFPDPNFWHAERSPYAPRHRRKTSGVVQPPLHATATLRVYRGAEDDAQAQTFLKETFPRLRAWHEYLYKGRDPEGEGLVYIRHPGSFHTRRNRTALLFGPLEEKENHEE